MAIVHLSGTKLAPQGVKAPLNRRFMYAMGFTFVIAMHFFMPNPGGAGLAISFNNTTWIAISIAIGIGLYQTGRNMSFRYTKLTLALLISCAIMTLPVLYTNASPDNSTGRLLGLWAGWLLFFTFQQFSLSNQHKQRLLWFIVVAVVIEALFGYVQYFLLEKGNLLGFNPELSRPYGIFQQPNVMASFLATGLVLSGYLLARQQQKYGQKLSRTSLLYLMPLITSPLLILLASRTGWLGAGLGVLCMIRYLYRFSTTKRLTGWIASVAAGVGLGVIIGFTSGGGEQITNKVSFDSPRQFTFPQTVDMFIEKPFTGYGYGRFEPEYILYTARQHQLNSSYPAGYPSMDHPHNELLYWAVEGGIVPLLGISLAVIFVLAKLLSVRKGTRLAIFGLFLPILIHSQLEYPFYHSAIHWISFVIFLFWLDQRGARYKTYNFTRFTRFNFRITSLLLPIIASSFLITNLHTNYVLTQFEKPGSRDPDILEQVTNAGIWKHRFDWDIYSTYLNIGLYRNEPSLIKPYIQWSLDVIQQVPRPALYSNLILAYQGIGEHSKAEQIRAEAKFLFPEIDFSNVAIKVLVADDKMQGLSDPDDR
ncbi:PglL family O-oligosaccharyltransferase [Vibrio sp. JC009]|uniref:PglL family O-oligosaccharyltransferase n=1 Tax=Vibrio sp. JC009 TaxID=2912314 RepID=UPI0023AF5F2A|nr:PglL family O-oligosaccharyltransferase [Vibrio sp. JC009]WED21579.1 PglL family O-oligosaccharyltransferase [Vibrio sp. JC009]